MMKIITVRDKAVEAYGTPFFTKTIGQAIRSFRDELARDESPMGQHPEDYDLYFIGDYEEESGAITAMKPLVIAKGTESRPIE